MWSGSAPAWLPASRCWLIEARSHVIGTCEDHLDASWSTNLQAECGVRRERVSGDTSSDNKTKATDKDIHYSPFLFDSDFLNMVMRVIEHVAHLKWWKTDSVSCLMFSLLSYLYKLTPTISFFPIPHRLGRASWACTHLHVCPIKFLTTQVSNAVSQC